MKSFLILLASVLFISIAPSVVSAQPVPPPNPHSSQHYVERCYTMMMPYPHVRCEYIRVRHNYRPAPVPYRFKPIPRPAPKPSYHPPHGRR